MTEYSTRNLTTAESETLMRSLRLTAGSDMADAILRVIADQGLGVFVAEKKTLSTPEFEAEMGKPVSAVYSGKNGCACGCNGTHSSAKGQITRVRNTIAKLIESGEAVAVYVEPDVYAAVETETHTYIAYTDGRVS